MNKTGIQWCDSTVNPTSGCFMLLIFDEPGQAHYTSNCDRSVAVQALREAADRIEARDDTIRN
jgi:hypothetical protein